MSSVVGEFQHQPRQCRLVEVGFAQLFEVMRIKHIGITDQMARQARQRALAALIGIERLFQRIDETTQEVIGVVADIRGHLRVAEIGLAQPMGAGAHGADEMRFAGARLAMKQQNAGLRGCRLGRATGHGLKQIGELCACLAVHQFDVDRIRVPDVVFPGDRVFERLAHVVEAGIVRGRRRGQLHLISDPGRGHGSGWT